MQLDFQAKEMTIKLVYYGPALSGKTTNLQTIHRLIAPERRSRLMTLETRDDRTLFFDLLPLSFNTVGGLTVRIKLFTVPGQVLHVATRKQVLQGVDGVAFVADSRISETRANQESFLDLQKNLKENGFDPERVPLVIQYNKQDLPKTRDRNDIMRMAAKGTERVFLSVATKGTGVVDTFLGLLETTWKKMEEEHKIKDRFDIDVGTVIEDLVERFGLADRHRSIP